MREKEKGEGAQSDGEEESRTLTGAVFTLEFEFGQESCKPSAQFSSLQIPVAQTRTNTRHKTRKGKAKMEDERFN